MRLIFCFNNIYDYITSLLNIYQFIWIFRLRFVTIYTSKLDKKYTFTHIIISQLLPKRYTFHSTQIWYLNIIIL